MFFSPIVVMDISIKIETSYPQVLFKWPLAIRQTWNIVPDLAGMKTFFLFDSESVSGLKSYRYNFLVGFAVWLLRIFRLFRYCFWSFESCLNELHQFVCLKSLGMWGYGWEFQHSLNLSVNSFMRVFNYFYVSTSRKQNANILISQWNKILLLYVNHNDCTQNHCSVEKFLDMKTSPILVKIEFGNGKNYLKLKRVQYDDSDYLLLKK